MKLQTQFLSASAAAELIRSFGLKASFSELLRYLEADFLRWAEFDKSARSAAHSANGVIELMPISDSAQYGFKYVNGHPKNTAQGLPTVMAFGVLADVATGMPLLISELTLATAIRTAAVSVLAARALARKDSRVMALIGCGAQSEFQALAFHQFMGIREIRLYDIDAAAMQKLIANLSHNPDAAGLKLLVCESVRDAVRGVDIVTTATAAKTRAAVITADLLEPGMHLNAIGGDCPGKTEIAPEAMQGASVFVEFEAQTRIEGDLQQMPTSFKVTELWQVLSGQKQGRTSTEQITLFDSVGFALEDFSTLRFLHDRANAARLGEPLDLVPLLADPKDLYSTIRPQAEAKPLSGVLKAIHAKARAAALETA
jgi:ornithine cyclodeaminase